jgi:hypothetical protein
MRGLGFSGAQAYGTMLPDYTIHLDGGIYDIRDQQGAVVNSGASGGDILNDAIDRVSPDGGMLGLKCLVTVDDQNINLLDSNSTIIFQGIGAAGGTSVAQMVTRSRSGIYMDGEYFIDNAFAAWNVGRFSFRDMALLFDGNTTDTDPNLKMDYTRTSIRRCRIGTQNCTYSADGIPGVISMEDTSPATPTTANVVMEDNWVLLKGANACAFYLHYEDAMYIRNTISFGGTGQRGIILGGVGITTVPYHNIWLDENAEGCKMFELFNSDKHCHIGSVNVSSQAGAGSTTPNLVFGYRTGTYTNDEMNYIVSGGIVGASWGVTPAAPAYLWEDADAQERTTFLAGSMFNELLVNPGGHTFICDGTYETVIPGAGGPPGQPFNVNTARDVDLTRVTQARVLGRGLGDQAGGNKGILIYNIDDAVTLCSSNDWAGAAVDQFVGDWTNVVVSGIRNCNAYGYSDNAAETMSAGVVELQLR